MVKFKLIPRLMTIVLLFFSTLLDCGTTYASIGHKLYLDGNPFIRSFDWTQLLIMQGMGVFIIASAFLFASKEQHVIWPNKSLGFWSFFQYRLKKGFKLSFKLEHFQTEMVYAGVLLIWVVTIAHFLAGIIAGSPFLGGPSFLDILRLIGILELRTAQSITTLFILLVAFIGAHYPLYLAYVQTYEGQE